MADEISLFALMDSHLSKTRLTETSLDGRGSIPGRSASDILSPHSSGPRLVIPNFFPGNSPMKDFLAEQISNTLKAKEKRNQEEEEQQQMEEEMRRLKIRQNQQHSTIDGMAQMTLQDEQEYIIDLTTAIIHQPTPNPHTRQPVKQELPMKSTRPKLPDHPFRWDKETCRFKPWNPNLLCTTDLSYILKQKIKKGKCSSFGKVLCSRLQHNRHVSVPYEIEKYESNINQFDFKTKSPCDIHQENQRKPKMSTCWTADILDFI